MVKFLTFCGTTAFSSAIEGFNFLISVSKHGFARYYLLKMDSILYRQKHCLGECKAITAVQRRECERQIAEDTVPAKRPATGLSRSSIKKQEADVGQYMHPKVPKQQQAVLNSNYSNRNYSIRFDSIIRIGKCS